MSIFNREGPVLRDQIKKSLPPSPKYLLVMNKPVDFIQSDTQMQIMPTTDFIANKSPFDLRKHSRVKVINLNSNYDYLSTGYYCSLLAEARGMRCIPNASTMIDLNWKRYYQESLPELETLLRKHFNESGDEPLSRTYSIYFGRTEVASLEPVARRIFDLFRFPLVSLEIHYTNKWEISCIEPLGIDDIPSHKKDFFLESLKRFTGAAWVEPSKNDKQEKYWIGILHDPTEALPPSNTAALRQFAKHAGKMNVSIELITKNDYASLLEYDALFIRATTSIDNYAFRFARKAASEGIPCIDDSDSIIRCCNKVFLHEILEANNVPVPKTLIMDRKTARDMDEKVAYPIVLKIPDGSFSRGVIKASNPVEFKEGTQKLFKESDIILAQEFVSSDYDWRIGMLGGVPIFACKYYMAKGHWQIYNHKSKKTEAGGFKTLDVADVPVDVLETAIKAANLVGKGLYGVDMKQTDKGLFVIEVNDNPNIDRGVEDKVAGDKLYQTIIQHLIDMIEGKRAETTPVAGSSRRGLINSSEILAMKHG